MENAFTKKLAAIEAVTAQYDDVISSEAADLRKEYNIISAAELEQHLASLSNENRLLNIGYIGRVKAGKSSLQNALFFNGKDILPKAATPMTASLTVMRHGDECKAIIEFYTEADISKIKAEHDAYKTDYERVYAEKKAEVEARAKKRNEQPDLSKAKRQADNIMQANARYASFDHYERMTKSGGTAPSTPNQTINAAQVDELMGKLNDYVGSSGRMMPFTKSVELFLPDFPENICVVDTPGINDPVPSRVIRTDEYLKKCDVVFIVSGAGQFLTREDTDLMDRLSAKEGVRELYLVAAKADDQLYGSVLDDAGGDLTKAINKIKSDLYTQSVETLQKLNESNPETAGQFDQLIQGGEGRVMVTSAMCHTMSLRYDDRANWDAGMKHVWDLLAENYPDNFSAGPSGKASLDMLSGIDAVKASLHDAQSKKDAIIARKQEDYLNQQSANTEQFAASLVKAVSDKIERVTNTDEQQLKAQKKNTESLFAKGTEAIDGTFEDCVDDFKANVKQMVSETSRNLFAGAKNETENAEKTITETHTRTRVKGTGFLNFISGGRFGNEQYDVSVEVTTVRAGAVKSTLNNLVTDLQETLVNSVETAKADWKKSVQSRVTSALNNAIDDVDLIDFDMLKKCLRRLVNNMELPELDLSGHAFSSSASGTLKDSAVESFMDEVSTYLSHLRSIFSKATGDFVNTLEKSAKREKMSDLMFADLKGQIESLEQEIVNKDATLDRLGKCLDALKEAA
jgi:predicted GTPase